MDQTDIKENENISIEDVKIKILDCISKCELDTSHALDQEDIFERWSVVNESYP